jgi:photosystem II stability/assembly factor-like uncharacterized protein
MNIKLLHTRLFFQAVVMLGFFTGSVFAQSNGWAQQTSGAGANITLYDIQFVDANNGWAAGDGQTIVHTTNGGQNWTTQRSNQSGGIYGIFFWDENNGWAAVDNGSVLHTTDGGANWSETSTSAPYLLDFDFVDANNGWAFGGLGAILHTTDGGAHWTSQTTNQGNDFYAGKFFNADTGVAVGYNGVIIRTTDGGANWVQESIGTARWFAGLSFVDNNNGWAAGVKTLGIDGAISHTTDGGLTWSTPTTISNTDFGDICFTDAQNGWVVGSRPATDVAFIYHTTDGGTNWTEQTFNVSVTNLKRISFVDTTTGWIAGDGGVILHTTNGGVTPVKEITGNALPQQFVLSQNYPNPFNPSTTIEFSISKQSFVTLKVYDLLGREVATLVNKELQAGSFKTQFDASSARAGLASGVYLYRLNAGGFVQTKKLMLMK